MPADRCYPDKETEMDLTTNYLGFELKNPLVVSPSPQCESLDNVKRMEDAGAAAVVLHSLFEEQIVFLSQELNANLQQGEESFAEALSYFPDAGEYRMGPDDYIEYVRRVKGALGIPVIGSLNGVSSGGWQNFAKQIPPTRVWTARQSKTCILIWCVM